MSRNVHTIILANGSKATRSAARRDYTHAIIVTTTEASKLADAARFETYIMGENKQVVQCMIRMEQVRTTGKSDGWTSNYTPSVEDYQGFITDHGERMADYDAKRIAALDAIATGAYGQGAVSWHTGMKNAQNGLNRARKDFPNHTVELVAVGTDMRPAKVETPAAPKATKSNTWTARLAEVLTDADSVTITAAEMGAMGWPASAAKHGAYWGHNPAGRAARAAGFTPSLRTVDGSKVLTLTRAA